jgi:hypothetical protein
VLEAADEQLVPQIKKNIFFTKHARLQECRKALPSINYSHKECGLYHQALSGRIWELKQ